MATFPLPKITLDERVVIMTGGDRGLGLSMAKALAKCGAKLVIAAIDKKFCRTGMWFFGQDRHNRFNAVPGSCEGSFGPVWPFRCPF